MTTAIATTGNDEAAGAAEAATAAALAAAHDQDGRGGQQADQPNDGDAGYDGAKHG